MATYSASNELGGTRQALAATYKTQLSLTGTTATLTTAGVFEFGIGTLGTPADNVLEYDVSRISAVGIGTAVVATVIDSGKRAAGTTGTANHTTEPTVTAASSLYEQAWNQRQACRWQAIDRDAELVVPATNAAGLAFRAKSAVYTGTVTCYALLRE